MPAGPSVADALAIENLTVRLRRADGALLELLSGVSLTLEPGRILGVIGESGSGKTMTCRAVVGALPEAASITGGAIRIGSHVTQVARRARVAMVFADPHSALDPLQRVGAQIAEVVRVRRGLARREATSEALRLLERVVLPEPERIARMFPFQLSGGMAQRVMIACVLAGRPQFILADEPTSALDATVQLEIIDLLIALARDEGVGIMLTTHDMAVAARACDTIAVMYAGRLSELAPASVLISQPEHPYTRLLLRARPRGQSSERLAAIPGEPPVPGQVTTACPFAPRCPYCQTICVEQEPPLIARGQTSTLCHFAYSLPPLEGE
jgi:peptide/nickel transport system ATP-binding protein